MLASLRNMTSGPLKNAALLFAAFVALALSARGEERKDPLIGSDWVEAPAAGYTDKDRKMIDGKVRSSIPVEVLAKALPKARLTRLETQAGWDKFIDRFARVNKETGNPKFVYGVDDDMGGGTTRVDFSPDFKSEVALIFSADKSQMEGLGHLMGIEVFEKKGRLRVFAFFLNESAFSDHAEQGGADQLATTPESKSEGHLYIVSVPKRLADHPVEYRMAAQSWGRICSSFSPAITFFDAAENESNNRAEQGGAEQPAIRSESK